MLNYADRVAALERFLLTHRNESLVLEDPARLQVQLLDYLDYQFEKGYSASVGEKLLPSVLAVYPQCSRYKSSLWRIPRAMQGWRRLRPPQTRLPLNWPICCAWATGFALLGQRELGIAVILAAVCYLRPGEVLGLRAGGLIRPIPAGAGSQQHFALVLFDPAFGRSSKTGHFHDSVILDGPHTWLGPLLLQIAKKLKPDQCLFDMAYPKWSALASAAADKVGLTVLKPVLYQLRHSGASIDSATGLRPLEAIRSRGRWAASGSMMRCEKHAQLGKTWQRLEPATREYALTAEAHIANDLSGAREPLEWPTAKILPNRKREKLQKLVFTTFGAGLSKVGGPVHCPFTDSVGARSVCWFGAFV